MNWTPETLARAFHESYGRVSPQFFGTQGNASDWDSIPEKSRQHMIAVCADVLGQPVEMKPEETGEPVPQREEFEEARASAPDNALDNWEEDLRRQIDEAARKAPSARKPFDGKLR